MSTDLSELMVELNAITEGTKEHIDTVELKTSAYGLVIDKSNPTAYEANKKAAASLGFDIDNLTPEQAKKVALKTYDIIQDQLSTDLKDDWKKLNTEHKLVLMDAKFNTGITFKDYTANALKYQKDDSKENLKNLVKESTRVQTFNRGTPEEYKARTKGLDNRVARVFNAVGIIEDLEVAKEMGLSKATDNIITPEIKSNFLEAMKPVETEQKESEVPALLDRRLYSEEPESLLDRAIAETAQEAIEPSPPELEEPAPVTSYRVQEGDTLSEIYERLDIPDLSRYEFYERVFANNPEAFGRAYKADTLKAGAILSLGSTLPEQEYTDSETAEPVEYSVSEDIDYESLDEDSDLFSPEMEIF